jgi:pyruvate dehydrogenase E1 component beta subunit
MVSYSRMAKQALAAAEQLAGEGIEAEVIDLRSLSPIYWGTCTASVRKTGRVLIAEEDSRFAGAGAEIAAGLTERCFRSLRAAPLRVAALDLPNPYNKHLEEQLIPQPADIAAAARAMLGENDRREVRA